MKTTMRIKRKGEIKMGEWHFKLGFIPLYEAKNYFMIHFGIFKMTSYPPEGEMITRRNYKGFWLRKNFFINGFEISI